MDLKKNFSNVYESWSNVQIKIKKKKKSESG